MYQITYKITARNLACFAIIVSNNIVTYTAPIGKWMRGKHIEKIKAWVNKKQGTLIRIK